MIGGFTVSKLYFVIATLFLKFNNFKGSTRILTIFFKYLPIKLGRIKHPLGFSWRVSSRDSLNTYLSSCEPFTTEIVVSLASKLETFICIGANRGWYPLVVGSRNVATRILAFECEPRIFTELTENISMNGNKSELFQFAIGDHDYEANLYMPNNGNGGMSTLYPMQAQLSEASIIESVIVTTLDSYFLEKNGLGRVLLLMDIEGSEMKALKGATLFLQNNNPVLIIEINPEMLEAAGSSCAEIFEYLENEKYESYWIDERGQLCQVLPHAELPHLAILPAHSGANYLFVKSEESWISKYKK